MPHRRPRPAVPRWRAAGAFVLLVLSSCGSGPPAGFDPRFAKAVTALSLTSYREDPQTQHFVRSSAWGEVPEKLSPDGQGAFSVAVPVLVQTETSEGPQADEFVTVLVRVVARGETLTLVPNDLLPGPVETWHDPGRRMVWFRGTTWQFQGRY